jgi:hypothetical protein
MRILMLRLLISWWFIALMWLCAPSLYLLFGETKSVLFRNLREISDDLWNGTL